MTFNIRGGLGMDGRRSTERIAEAVAAQSPDVVCFQEVHQRLPWSGFVDQPRRLQKSLGMPLVFQRNLNIGIGGYGLAIASRLPILSTRRHFLPSVGERRGALEVTVQTPTRPVAVWCTHWGLREDERERQAAQMAAWLAAAPGPRIVCGDFNERADAPALRRLLAETGLRDSGAQATRRPTRRTSPRPGLTSSSPRRLCPWKICGSWTRRSPTTGPSWPTSPDPADAVAFENGIHTHQRQFFPQDSAPPEWYVPG